MNVTLTETIEIMTQVALFVVKKTFIKILFSVYLAKKNNKGYQSASFFGIYGTPIVSVIVSSFPTEFLFYQLISLFPYPPWLHVLCCQAQTRNTTKTNHQYSSKAHTPC